MVLRLYMRAPPLEDPPAPGPDRVGGDRLVRSSVRLAPCGALAISLQRTPWPGTRAARLAFATGQEDGEQDEAAQPPQRGTGGHRHRGSGGVRVAAARRRR